MYSTAIEKIMRTKGSISGYCFPNLFSFFRIKERFVSFRFQGKPSLQK